MLHIAYCASTGLEISQQRHCGLDAHIVRGLETKSVEKDTIGIETTMIDIGGVAAATGERERRCIETATEATETVTGTEKEDVSAMEKNIAVTEREQTAVTVTMTVVATMKRHGKGGGSEAMMGMKEMTTRKDRKGEEMTTALSHHCSRLHLLLQDFLLPLFLQTTALVVALTKSIVNMATEAQGRVTLAMSSMIHSVLKKENVVMEEVDLRRVQLRLSKLAITAFHYQLINCLAGELPRLMILLRMIL